MLIKNILCISCSSLITQEMRHPLSRTKTWRHRHKPLFPNFEPGLLLCGIFLVMLLDYLTYPSVSCTKCVCPYPSIHIKMLPLVYLIISIIKKKSKKTKKSETKLENLTSHPDETQCTLVLHTIKISEYT